jgi:hypothetical protein
MIYLLKIVRQVCWMNAEEKRLEKTDPYWRDHLLFSEFFHGDNGADIGASHQTGWTGP